jgi:cysteine desulfuration protein SufE
MNFINNYRCEIIADYGKTACKQRCIMEINQRIETVKDRFNQFDNWEDKYREVIKFGKGLAELSEAELEDKFKIKGCQSQVWLKPSFKAGVLYFKAASDAVLVKGIIAIVVEVYSGSKPEDIINTKATFLQDIGISEHLSMNRTNGLASMIKQVQMYAMIFKSLADKGILDADNF